MGVMATYCQICGIPVHQDHYVPAPGGMMGIYRGGGDGEVVAPAIPFGDEHAWLKDAVGLALDGGEDVIEGEVHDGGFQDEDGEDIDDSLVMDGVEDRAALHRRCWELAGKPESYDELEDVRMPDFETYREQLFDFKRFVADGNGWMLVDPAGKTPDAKKNRQRISKALGRKG